MNYTEPTQEEKEVLHIGVVSGSITVYNGARSTQKHIAISKEWATEEYYTIEDDGECLIIKKCYMEVPKTAKKLRGNKHISIEHSEIQNGEYVFDSDESNEDEVTIYYR